MSEGNEILPGLGQDEDAKAIVLTFWDLVAVCCYFLAILSVGLFSMFRPNRDTVSGFFLAGRHMFWLPVGASLFASNIGSEHFIGLSGSGAASGIGVGAFEVNALVLLQMLGFIFLPVYIASKVCTLPEYMMKRFGGQRIRMYLAGLSMLLYVFTKISVNLYSGGIFIQQALQWNIYYAILALLAMTCICTIGGGLAAVIYIDVVQVLIMIAGSSVLLFKGLEEVGGWNLLQEKFIKAIPSTTFVNPNDNSTCGIPKEDSWLILRDPVGSDMPWPGFLFGQTPASIWYWCADQMMVQKALSAKSLSDAQGATILTGWIKILPLFLIVVPGMISRVLYPNEVGCVDPEICMAVCQNPSSCSNIAYPKLVLGIMPEGLRGIMISVMLAALMSDLTSIFNSASTLFTMDVYRKFRAKAGTKELLLVGRMAILGLVVISILWVPIIQKMQGGQLFVYIQVIAAYLSPPIAMVFCMAISWRRMNERGAFWGLMVGLVVGMVRMFLEFAYPAPKCVDLDERPFGFLKIHYMYFACILFWLTGVVSFIVSLCTEPEEDFRVVRTTIWTKYDKDPRPDDKAGAEELRVEQQPLNGDQDVEEAKEYHFNYEETTRSPIPIHLRLIRWFCGFTAEDDSEAKADKAKLATHLNNISCLEQSKKQKCILYLNLVIILSAAFGLYAYFCVNPFTSEEISEMQAEKLRNVTVMGRFP